jgi:hypothetical protein
MLLKGKLKRGYMTDALILSFERCYFIFLFPILAITCDSRGEETNITVLDICNRNSSQQNLVNCA